MYLAGILSWGTLCPPLSDQEFVEGERVVHESGAIAMDPEGVAAIQETVSQDCQCQMVKTLIRHGWPQYLRDIPAVARLFCSVKNLLHCEDGILYVGEVAVVKYAFSAS